MKFLITGMMILLITFMGYSMNAVSVELQRLDELKLYQEQLRIVEEETKKQERIQSRVRFHKQEIECLAKNMYFEARGEESMGQDAVAFVTINRVRSDRYPDTICDVIYQAKTDSQGRPLRNLCQFSWYCDGKVDTPNERIYNRLYRRAEYIYINYYLNDMMEDTTNGSTHYHSNKVKPYWSKHKNYQYVASIGQHLFYQPTY